MLQSNPHASDACATPGSWIAQRAGPIPHTALRHTSWSDASSCVVAPAEGKPIPHDLRHDEAQLRREVELEDDNTAVTRNHIDDEYAHAGEVDPKVLITTSREPSSRLTQFAKVGQGWSKIHRMCVTWAGWVGHTWLTDAPVCVCAWLV